MTQLFRPEAVRAATRRLDGEVVLAAPLSHRLLTLLAVGVALFAVGFAAFGSYARRETVVGWIAPTGGLIRVSAREGGIVERLPIAEGQMVKAGERIADLRLSSDTGQGDAGVRLAADVAAELEAQAAATAAAEAKLENAQGQMADRQRGLERELAEVRSQAEAAEGRVKIARANAERAETLRAQGFLSQRDLDNAKGAALAAAQELAQARTSALSYERQLAEVRGDLRAAPLELAATRAQSRALRAQLQQKETQAAVQSTYAATAPISGRIVAIPIQPGQSLAPGQVVAVIVPEGQELGAELYAPSRAAGFIRQGQQVRLKYEAYPYQKFGIGEAVVTSVSRTVLAPAEVAIPGLEVREPVFRVRAKLSKAEVMAYGRAAALQPGMLLSADVILDRRSLLEWLLDPLYAVGRRA